MQSEGHETSLEREEILATETLGNHRVPESSLSWNIEHKGNHTLGDYSNGAGEQLPRIARRSVRRGLPVLLQQRQDVVWFGPSSYRAHLLCHHSPLIERRKLCHSKEMFISTR